MKTRNFTKNLAIAFIFAATLSFTACSSEGADNAFSKNVTTVVEDAQTDSQQAESPYTVLLSAQSGNTDVTTTLDECNATLYVFDQDNEFVKTVNVSTFDIQNRRSVDIAAPGTESITVVAWSGLGNSEEVTVLNNANIISDLQVSLKESNGIANLPSDMFYGMVTITRSQTKVGDVQQLVVSRKTTNLFLRMSGMSVTADDDFHFVVRQSKSAINHAGEYAGDYASYIVPATLSANGKNIITDHFPVLASSLVDVALYQNGELVYSAKNLENAEKLALNAGEQLKVTFDINKTSYTVATGGYNDNIMEI